MMASGASRLRGDARMRSFGFGAGVLALCLVCFVAQVQLVESRYGGSVRRLGEYGDDVSEWKFVHGRALLQATTSSSKNYRPLAPRDDRLDPLNNFNNYYAGYDIKSKHYWASVIFTGISGYAIAVAWLVLGLLLLLFACCKCMCGPRSHSKRPRSRAFYWTPRVIVFLLSGVAVGASVILLIAGRRFNSQVYNVEDVLIKAAQNATDNLHNVSSTLGSVKNIVQPYNQQMYVSLNSTETKLDSLAGVVNDKVFVNKKTYQKVFKIVEIVLIVVTSFNLLLITLGFASTFLKWRRFFYLIIFVTWIFIALTWFLFGFFFTVHHVADDTCLAFKEYLQDPRNTTLDDLLPCADLASSSTQYLQIREVMKSVITSATDNMLYYANGSTSLTGVCDPLGPAPDYHYTGICANDTLPIGELSNIVKPFVCNDTRSACLATYTFYVNQSTYDGIAAISKASQTTLDAFPVMEALTNCSLLKTPIDNLVQVRCGPAKVAINRIWICFAVLSSIMVLLICFWCLANRRNTEQRYITSITPQEGSFNAVAMTPYNVMQK
ncbi:hypothetical protein M758_6G143600 [Ceratodon purpureus]|uniref:Uncharacterized protein n=1 Tax=Ceratodon purpureus TaxID=3225 RepID=A0A8T0HI63_CERPU|nr:hypothetical protein KC19_6G149100 [Ceratodon purpureus]KAG0614002.1 hypothetical protein M758_6G143600 [Ceratodon purpureus]